MIEQTADAKKLSPLLLAVQVGKEMMVRNLLLAGANVQVHKQLLSCCPGGEGDDGKESAAGRGKRSGT